ncbi:YeeE/YedE thiosulfate transporter family protein [Oleisolibacter albus]|uniref:YeeE/YedE thiosulfate transporter family protein n=1 Tax=Oleisolibacter albus TaxID=2171757 RepID=UPI0012D71AC8|nr:YeeE/YedE thiosulfate transporter family protein [Oleisolibacter albus]
MSAVLLLVLSLPLAFAAGMAAQKGSICAVAAVNDLMTGKGARHLLSILACSLWVAAVTVPLHWLNPEGADLAYSLPVSGSLLLGGLLFGAGAAINRGCAFSTLSRCSAGDLSHLATALGLGLGLLGLAQWRGLAAEVPKLDRLSPFDRPHVWSALLVLVLVWFGAMLMAKLIRHRAWRDAWTRPAWNPFAATAIIGVAGGTLYALHGPWMYTSLLPRLLGQPVSPDGLPGWAVLVLMLAVLAGGGTAARLAGRRGLRFAPARALRCLCGGTAMGAGGALAYGGNDVLVLHSLPALAAHAVPGYLAILAGAALVLGGKRLLGMGVNRSRHPAGTGQGADAKPGRIARPG